MLDFKTTTLPTNGTNEIQTLTIGGTPTGGTFKLSWSSRASGAITWSATNATLLANVQAALDGLFGVGNTLAAVGSLTAGIGTITITFQGTMAALAQPFVLSGNASGLTGTAPTASVAQTTPGVTASYRGAGPADRLIYTGTTPPTIYENQSNIQFAPSWIVRGTGTIVQSGVSGTIAAPKNGNGNAVITYNTAAGGYTLTPPTAGTDDGKELTIASATNKAHVITCSDGFNAKGSSGTATFGTAIGNGITLLAYQGHWYVTANMNVTLA